MKTNTSRQLKFRVWDRLGRKYTYSDTGYQGHYILSLSGEFTNLQNGVGGRECIVQQFTGLKDRMGIDIYEGDIVHNEFNREDCKIGTVAWDSTFAMFGVDYGFQRLAAIDKYLAESRLRVIGNDMEGRCTLAKE